MMERVENLNGAFRTESGIVFEQTDSIREQLAAREFQKNKIKHYEDRLSELLNRLSIIEARLNEIIEARLNELEQRL